VVSRTALFWSWSLGVVCLGILPNTCGSSACAHVARDLLILTVRDDFTPSLLAGGVAALLSSLTTGFLCNEFFT
jgi:hypothetical protein